MTNLNNSINVSIATDAPPVGSAGFGVMLVLADMTFADSSRIKYYSSASEASEDTDLTTFQKDAISAAFSQSPKPAQVAAGSADITGSTDSDYGEALDAIVAENNQFYGIVADTRTQSQQEPIAAWALSNNRLYLAQSSNADDLDGADTTSLGYVLSNGSNNRAAVLYHATDSEAADAAWMAQSLAVDPDSSTTVWRYKTLAGIQIDSLTTTQINGAHAKDVNVYEQFYGQGATAKGTLADGSKLDVRITVDWCLARVQEGIAQQLLAFSNRGSKIPFDDTGFKVIESVVREVLELGEDVGHFIRDTSFVDMPARTEVTDADALNRILRFDFGAGLSGAVEELVVDGTLSVDLDLIDNLAGR